MVSNLLQITKPQRNSHRVQHYRLRLKPSGDLKTDVTARASFSKVRMRRPFRIMVDANVPLVPEGFRKLAVKGLVGIVFLRSINNIVSLIAEATEALHLGKETINAFSDRCAELERDLETVRGGFSLGCRNLFRGLLLSCRIFLLPHSATSDASKLEPRD